MDKKIKLSPYLLVTSMIALMSYHTAYTSALEIDEKVSNPQQTGSFQEKVRTIPLSKSSFINRKMPSEPNVAKAEPPKSPTMSVRGIKEPEIERLDTATRLGKNRPFAQQIFAAHRKVFQEGTASFKGVIIYDDGGSDEKKIEESFNNYFAADGQFDKIPQNFSNSTVALSEYGQHATAVAMTLVQVGGDVPILSLGGDNVKGDYSGGISIDQGPVKVLEALLSNPETYEKVCHSAQVLNCSYGMDIRGNHASPLDEGGLWEAFWKLPGTIVVQAAGNEGRNLSADNLALETAQNMVNTYKTLAWRGRLIQVMASAPSEQGPVRAHFSNYYKNLSLFEKLFTPEEQVFYAQDHTLLAPGESVLIPGDPFDINQDKVYFDWRVCVWDGTSAAAPLVSGSIARLTNEFDLSGYEAAAVLLESATIIKDRHTLTKMKELNLGAAFEEALRRRTIKQISQRPLNVMEYYEDLLRTYFSEANFDYNIDSMNYLLDTASRLGILYVHSKIEEIDKKFSQAYLYTIGGKGALAPLSPGLYIHNTNNPADYAIIYIPQSHQPLITRITSTRESNNQYSFTFSGFNLKGANLPECFTSKGILESKLTWGRTGHKVTVTIDPRFQSNRRFVLAPKNITLATTQDLFFKWAWNKIS